MHETPRVTESDKPATANSAAGVNAQNRRKTGSRWKAFWKGLIILVLLFGFFVSWGIWSTVRMEIEQGDAEIADAENTR